MKKHKRQEFSTVALPTFFVRSNNVRAFQKKKRYTNGNKTMIYELLKLVLCDWFAGNNLFRYVLATEVQGICRRRSM